MTNQTTRTESANKPGYVAKTRKGKGENAVYERIGVAWKNEDGSFYVRMIGTQAVSEFMLYEIEPAETVE